MFIEGLIPGIEQTCSAVRTGFAHNAPMASNFKSQDKPLQIRGSVPRALACFKNANAGADAV
jgi:hypothetical protein